MLLFSDNKNFKDRKDAGNQLGKALEEYKNKNALILGVPRGGVEVGYYVAKHLNAELSTVVTKKLPYPGQEELGFGSMAEDGSVFISERIRSEMTKDQLEKIIDRQMQEIERRVKLYRKGKPAPDMKDRVVILVDDGIAAGTSLVPAVDMCKKRGACKVIVAAPVAGTDKPKELKRIDDYVILERPEFFYSIGQVYDDFGSLEDKEVIEILKKADELKK